MKKQGGEVTSLDVSSTLVSVIVNDTSTANFIQSPLSTETAILESKANRNFDSSK